MPKSQLAINQKILTQPLMKKSIAIQLGCLLVLVNLAYSANPSISYVELTDVATHAGTRKSKTNLKLVKRDSVSVNATANVDDGTGSEQISWTASAGNITGAGISATWNGTENAGINAVCDGVTTTDNVIIVADHKVSQTIIDGDNATAKVALENFNSLISKLGYNVGIRWTGKVEIEDSDVDYHDDGEKIGKKKIITGKASISLGHLDATITIPTVVPGLEVKAGAGLDLQKFELTGSGGYDESKENPWADSVTGSLSASAGVSVTAGLAAGIASVDVASLTCTGSCGITITGTIRKDGNDVILGGGIKADSLKIAVKLTWNLGIDYDIIDETFPFGDTLDKKFADSIVYTFTS